MRDTNKSISNNFEAFSILKENIENNKIPEWAYSLSTSKATINQVELLNITLGTEEVIESWVLDKQLAIDKEGLIRVRLGCL